MSIAKGHAKSMYYGTSMYFSPAGDFDASSPAPSPTPSKLKPQLEYLGLEEVSSY